MKIKIEIEVSKETLEDIFITAFEGGSNYWYFLNDDAVDLVRKAVPVKDEPFLSVAVLKAILDHGVDVPINDAENEEDVVGTISSKTMQERLQKLWDSNSKWALDLHLKEQGDADSADVVFQYLAMGEVVYG